jgi:hypothetical protein
VLLATPPSPVALSVSPARIAVTAPASRAITLRNTGVEDVLVEVTRRAVGESAAFKSWVHNLPARQTIRAGRSARFTLRVSRSARATPGDHAAVVFLTTRRPRAEGVAVRLRVGVRLIVRMPGRLVRRVEVGRPRVRRGRIILWVANRGNVIVPLRHEVSATLRRGGGGRVAARLRPRIPALLLPRGRVAMVFQYPRRLRGLFTFDVRVGRVARRYSVWL